MITKTVFFVIFAGFLFFSMYELHPFGDIDETQMDDYMITNAQNETAANNVVTSIVFDYRGYDTLGEATILFAAIAGTLAILRKIK